jgi:hypothetical protein
VKKLETGTGCVFTKAVRLVGGRAETKGLLLLNQMEKLFSLEKGKDRAQG